MQTQAPPNSSFDRQALRELARTRIDGLARRAAFYALAAAISAAFVPVFWEALCLGLIALAEFAEHRAARALLAADGTGTDAAEARRANALAAAHIATASAVALAQVADERETRELASRDKFTALASLLEEGTPPGMVLVPGGLRCMLVAGPNAGTGLCPQPGM